LTHHIDDKYFGGIAGHDFIKGALARAAREGRVAHAYLFAGPSGVGKKLVALGFAKLLNCRLSESGDGAPCRCPSCTKVDRGVHPDVFIVEYKGARDIRVEQIREEVEERVSMPPFEGRFKVGIVDDAHRMNPSAQNAFLKTLEEPPAGTVLILVTSQPESLLPTIRSRCQRYEFSSLPDSLIAQEVASRLGLSVEDAGAVARLAQGSMAKALRLDEALLALRSEVLKHLGSCDPENPSSILRVAELLPRSASKEEEAKLEMLFDTLGGLLSDAVRLKLGAEEPQGYFEGSLAKKIAEGCTLEGLAERLKLVEGVRREVLARAVNRQLAVESLLMSIVDWKRG
jgi:DNA polymerase-3 subunit delta'